ncbi:MAG: ABC transporter ATP-binding protein [Woeseiaceae bacterium]|nr:ABC transporter ATP-binding protein [Woeseiaceae bacterium]
MTDAIRLSGVNKHYSHFELNDIDLTLEKGSIMGFIGPNGAGKSTTMRIIMGLVAADSGTVEVLGHRIPEQQVAAKWNIGFASEDMNLYKSATVNWHIDFIKSIYPSWDDDYAQLLLKRFDIRPDQRVKGLSHGQRVKAGLLLVLARRPKVLLLDEPTTGLDPVARTEVLNELMDVLADEDRAVLFSSHNTRDVEQISDKITFLDRGRIIDSRDKETFLDSWRRIRFEAPADFDMPELPAIASSQHNGRLATVTTADFDPEITERLTRRGAVIQSIDNMTLEEIFVSEVMSSREGEAA